jgi:hypothetical protein
MNSTRTEIRFAADANAVALALALGEFVADVTTEQNWLGETIVVVGMTTEHDEDQIADGLVDALASQFGAGRVAAIEIQ